jgi:hypothetical protein
MKNSFAFLGFLMFLFSSCTHEEESIRISINFTHHWNGVALSIEDLNELKFVNESGQNISIEKLRYLISEVSLMGYNNYQLINFTENTGTSIVISDFTKGTYALTFRFGLSDENNIDGIYKDLNSVNFGVPGMLGGGYHYMQFDGKYLNNNQEETGFNYHAIRAVDKTDSNNLKFEDTSFEIDLGSVAIINNTEIEIKMNLAEWFKNPNIWDLNKLNTVLMPNFEAQKMMRDNGKTVFSLGSIK